VAGSVNITEETEQQEQQEEFDKRHPSFSISLLSLSWGEEKKKHKG